MSAELHSIIEDMGYIDCPESWRGLRPKENKVDGNWIDRADVKGLEEFLVPHAAFADFLLDRGIT